jgi:serine/threonine-protein kinase OSR1/STK39
MTRRKSFVGTPSFIARELVLRPVGIADAKQPAEIVQQKHYDYKCDIWSFGILAFELSTGKPPNPFSTVAAVLQKTVTEDSPSIDREGGQYKYSKAFKELVDTSRGRPSAATLLDHPFFKNAKPRSYLVSRLLKDLPPLETRQSKRV